MNDYFNRYLNLKKMYSQLKKDDSNQTSGAIYIDENTLKRYSGSGILLFELYNNRPTIILFKSSERDVYEDLGGGLDYDDLIMKNPLKSAAIREAFEESRGLINITDPKYIKYYVDGNFGSKHYRSYLLRINSNSLIDNYYNNKKIIDNNKKIKHTMKETTDISRFYIDDLIKDGILESVTGLNFTAFDINHKTKKIYTRTVDIIKLAIKDDIIKNVIDNPIDFVELKTFIPSSK